MNTEIETNILFVINKYECTPGSFGAASYQLVPRKPSVRVFFTVMRQIPPNVQHLAVDSHGSSWASGHFNWCSCTHTHTHTHVQRAQIKVFTGAERCYKYLLRMAWDMYDNVLITPGWVCVFQCAMGMRARHAGVCVTANGSALTDWQIWSARAPVLNCWCECEADRFHHLADPRGWLGSMASSGESWFCSSLPGTLSPRGPW